MSASELPDIPEEHLWTVDFVNEMVRVVGDDRPVMGVLDCPRCGEQRLRFQRFAGGNRLYTQCLNPQCLLKVQIQVGGYGPLPEPRDTPPALWESVFAVRRWHECRHLEGIDGGDARCAAGVVFESVVDRSGRRPLYPCMRCDGVADRCSAASFRTAEEALEEGLQEEAEYDAAQQAAMDRYVRRNERVRQGVELVLQVVRRPCGHLDYAFDQEQADGLRNEMCSCDGEKLHPGQERLPADPELVADVNRTIREGLAHWLRGNCLCGAPLIGAQEREAWECAECREADGPASGEPAGSSEPDPVNARYERRRRPEPPEKEEPIRLRWPPEKREKPES